MRDAALVFRQCIFFSVLCSVLSSVPIALISIAKGSEESKILGLLIPAVFWLGLSGEQFFFWRANHYRKMLEKQNGRYPKRIRGKPGIFSLFRTTEGMAADVLFLISLIVFIVIASFGVGKEALQCIMICCVILSFRLHCIFNGINYRYYKILLHRSVERHV